MAPVGKIKDAKIRDIWKYSNCSLPQHTLPKTERKRETWKLDETPPRGGGAAEPRNSGPQEWPWERRTQTSQMWGQGWTSQSKSFEGGEGRKKQEHLIESTQNSGRLLHPQAQGSSFFMEQQVCEVRMDLGAYRARGWTIFVPGSSGSWDIRLPLGGPYHALLPIPTLSTHPSSRAFTASLAPLPDSRSGAGGTLSYLFVSSGFSLICDTAAFSNY